MKKKYIGVILIIFIFIICAGIMVKIYKDTEQQLKNDLFNEALLVTKMLNFDHLSSLTGTIEDMEQYEYKYLLYQMAQVHEIFPKYRFIDMFKPLDQHRFMFYFESSRKNTLEKDKSKPGEIWDQVDQACLDIVTGKSFGSVYRSEDIWGRWVTASIPIYDPTTGEFFSIFTFDCDASEWLWLTFSKLFYTLLLFLLLVALIIVGLKLQNSHHELFISNQRFLNTLESMADGFIYFTHSMDHEYINNKAFKILDLVPDHIKANNLLNLLPEEFINLPKNALADKKEHILTEFVKSLGKWIEFRVYPSKDNISLFFLDVSSRKNVENAFYRTQKMVTINEMTYAFAHDFNNYLQVILANVSVLENLLQDQPDLIGYAQKISNMTNDAAERIKLLQKFSGSHKPNSLYQRINLNVLCKEAVVQASAVLKAESDKKGIGFTLQESYLEVPDCSGNENDLITVIYDLIKNAIEAMPNGGEITIETGTKPDGVYIHLTDTGCGMSEEVCERIFEPFYTTKGFDIGKGTGLFNAFNIINAHQGKINIIFTKPNCGTKLEILLPHHNFIEEEEKTPTEPVIISKTAKDKKELRIVWVDDDDMIREIAEEFISIIGYKATLANGGEQALNLMKEQKFDVLITDIGMPRMNGWQLIKKVNELYPEQMRIIVISGWGNQITEEQRVINNVDYVLSKPIKLDQLRKILEE